MTGQVAWLAVWVGLSVMGEGPPAEPPAANPGDLREAPWTRAPQDEQDKGLALFNQANAALHDSELRTAVKIYHEALGHWDHPAFHYNLGIALLALTSHLECHKQFEAAIRYGPEPLNNPEKYKNAKSILAELEQQQLARLELSCDEPEAEVTVDERKNLVTCPGSFGEWTQPGIHVVRITKGGFYPTKRDLNLKAGERYSFPLHLYTEAQWTHTRSRWPIWMPWTLMASGAAAGAIGAGLHALAGNRFKAYDDEVLACVGGAIVQTFDSCIVAEHPNLGWTLFQANAAQIAAWSLYVGGAVTLTIGAVLLSLNFPQPYLVDPESGAAVSVAPLLAPGSRGIVFVLGF